MAAMTDEQQLLAPTDGEGEPRADRLDCGRRQHVKVLFATAVAALAFLAVAVVTQSVGVPLNIAGVGGGAADSAPVQKWTGWERGASQSSGNGPLGQSKDIVQDLRVLAPNSSDSGANEPAVEDNSAGGGANESAVEDNSAGGGANEPAEEEIVGAIHWQHHPEYCVTVDSDENQVPRVYINHCSDIGQEAEEALFRVSATGTGFLRWHSQPDLCLHVIPNSFGLPVAGAGLDVLDCDDAVERNNMRWKAPNGGVGMISLATHGTLCLDVENETEADGTRLQVMSCHFGHSAVLPNQGTYYTQHFYMPSQCNAAPPAGSIRWKAFSDFCVEVVGANILIEECMDTAAQRYNFPGCHIGRIQNEYTGECLRVTPGDNNSIPWGDGAQVDMWDCSDASQDVFMNFTVPYGRSGGCEAYQDPGSNTSFISGPIRWTRAPFMCLDVAEGKNESGTRLQLWGCPEHHIEILPNKLFVVPTLIDTHFLSG